MMTEFSTLKGVTMNLLGQDIKDMIAIADHFGVSNIVGVKQAKEHGHKQYTVRLCNSSANTMRDVLLEINAGRVVLLESLRIL